jgi:hypothetical protein
VAEEGENPHLGILEPFNDDDRAKRTVLGSRFQRALKREDTKPQSGLAATVSTRGLYVRSHEQQDSKQCAQCCNQATRNSKRASRDARITLMAAAAAPLTATLPSPRL